jgi:type II secretory pathway component PulF
VTAALTYPAVVAATTGAVVVFLLVWVLPQVRVLVAEAGGPPPWPTRIALGVGDLLAATWWLLLAAAGAVAFSARRAIRRRDATAWLARAARLPIAGLLLRDAAAARAAHALGTLLDAGTPLDAALPLAGDAAGPLFAPAFAAVTAHVRDGRALSAAFAATGTLPPLLTRLAATGERAGTLGASLAHAAAVLDDDVARRLERLLAWLEPALVLGTGALVLAVVAAVLMPILGLDPAGAR